MGIERVELRNWRNHVYWEGTFRPGINFLLGPNGSGKSSLLRAIEFALSGATQSAPKDDVHMGSREGASVSVTLNGSGQLATITRSIDQRGLTSEALSTDSGGARTVADLVVARFGAEGSDLGRLLFLNEGDVYAATAGDTGLGRYLEQLLPLQSIRQVATNAQMQRKTLERTLQGRRKDLKLSKEEEATLSARRSELEAKLKAIEETEEGLRSQERDLTAQVRESDAQRQAEVAQEGWEESTHRLLTSLGLGGLQVHEALDRARSETRSTWHQVRELRTEVGRLEGQNLLLDRNIESLTTASPEQCPLCEQQLTDEHLERLLTDQRRRVDENNEAIKSLEAQLDEVESGYDTWADAADAIRLALAQRPKPPTAESPAEFGFEERLEEIRAKLQDIGGQRRQIFEELAEVREQLATAEANRRIEFEVIEAFRKNALLEAVGHAVEAFTSEVHANLITPLKDELGRQWKSFRPQAPWNLILDDQGRLGIEMDGETRPYASLSAGEKTVAVVLLRLALAVAFTSSDFIVLDEPLEHLDPRTRRVLVSSLHHAVETETIGQILVSTYEEALVRRMQQDDWANAIYLG